MSEVVTSPGAANSPVKVGKSPFKSKTLWMSLITVILPFVPVLGPLAAANSQLVGVALGVIFGLLRLITKDRIVVS